MTYLRPLIYVFYRLKGLGRSEALKRGVHFEGEV